MQQKRSSSLASAYLSGAIGDLLSLRSSLQARFSTHSTNFFMTMFSNGARWSRVPTCSTHTSWAYITASCSAILRHQAKTTMIWRDNWYQSWMVLVKSLTTLYTPFVPWWSLSTVHYTDSWSPEDLFPTGFVACVLNMTCSNLRMHHHSTGLIGW